MPEFLILTEILKNLIFLKPAFSLAISCISIFVVFILIKVPFSQKFYKVELDKNRSNFTEDLQKIWKELQKNYNFNCAHLKIDGGYDGCIKNYLRDTDCKI